MKHLRFTAVILTLAMLLGLFPTALAEDAEVYSVSAEEDVGEVLEVYSAPVEESVDEAVDFGDTGLFAEAEGIPDEYVAIPEAPIEDLSADTAIAPEAFDAFSSEALYEGEGDYAVSAPITTNGYTVDNGVLTAWGGDSTSLSVPESLGITVVGNACFQDNAVLQSVALPNGITTLGENAFLNCAALKSISLPGSLTTIGSGAFMNCAALESITLPASVASFGANVFDGCTALTVVNVYPESAALQYCVDNSIAYAIIEAVPVQGVQLSKVELALKVGKTEKLEVSVLPADATNANVSWSSSDTAVATVKNGVVTAVAPGTAVITVVSAADASKTAVCSVKVTEGVSVANVVLSQSALSLGVGGSAALTAAVLPANATNSAVKWASSDTSVATVVDGVVTAVAPGAAIITVASASDATKATSCAVSVTQSAVAVTGVTLDQIALSMKVGETWKLTASVLPADAANTAVVWASSDPSVASIAGGVVTALKPGTVSISIASAADSSKTAVCSVTISEGVAVNSVLLSQSALSLAVDEKATLTAAILPVDATNQKLVWTSSDTSVATVKNGVVTAHQVGVATITATSASNGAVADSCVVNVVADAIPVTGVTLNQSRLSLNVGDTWQLVASILPADASNTAVSWASSDTAVIGISGGVVTALSAGTANITVTSAADPTKTAACIVTVASPVAVTSIALDQTSLALFSGDSATLNAAIEPADATSKDIFWASSDASVATVRDGVITALKPGNAIITAASVANAAMAASCAVTVTEPIPVTAVFLSQSSLSLGVGGTATLTTAILPASATNKQLVWASSDTDIATVKDGVVTARRVGTVTITASSSSNAAMAASCVVNVTDAAVPVIAVTLEQDWLVMNLNETRPLASAVWPVDATNSAVTWASSDASIVSVSGGVITALQPGTATIFVTSVADTSKSASCVVTVPQGIPVADVVLSQNVLTLSSKETATLTAAILPSDATNQALSWASSDTSVATVKDGVITAVGAGVTTVTATSVADNTKAAACEVTVASGIITATSITLSNDALVLAPGESWKLEATVLPEDAANTAIIWESSDSSVASVIGGVVVARNTGVAVISATSSTGAVKNACTVSVVTIASIAFANPDLVLNYGEVQQITPVILPENAPHKEVFWASSDPSVVTIADGIITAVGAGTATIAVAPVADPSKIAYGSVTVLPPPSVESITLASSELAMRAGDTLQLTPVILPETVPDKRVYWATDKPTVATIADGILTAVGPGTALIAVAPVADPSKIAFCTVTVTALNRKVLTKTGSNGTVTLVLGEQLQLDAQFATSKGWVLKSSSSSKSKVATIDSTGIVTALREGKTTITVRTKNKKKAKLTVKVVDPRKPTAVAISQGKTYVLKVGESLQLNAVLAPATAVTSLSWSSSKRKIAAVSADGLVVALKKGSSTVTVKTANGKKSKIKIKVVK